MVKVTPDGLTGYDARAKQFIPLEHVAIFDGRPHAQVDGEWVPLPALERIERRVDDIAYRNAITAWQTVYEIPKEPSLVAKAWERLSGVSSSAGEAVLATPLAREWDQERRDARETARASIRVGEHIARFNADAAGADFAAWEADLRRSQEGIEQLGTTLHEAGTDYVPTTKPTSVWDVIPTDSSAGKAASAIVGVYQGLYGGENSEKLAQEPPN